MCDRLGRLLPAAALLTEQPPVAAAGDQQVELALLGPDLGDVDVEEADRIALEPRALGLVAIRIRQA
jgi:hypothetical protein